MPYKEQTQRRSYQRKWANKKRKEQRIDVIKTLGGSCVRCGIDDIRVLQIDHVVPILRKNIEGRQSNQTQVYKIYNGTLKKEDFQILCANCHQIKTTEEDSRHFKYRNKYSL